MNRNTVLDSYTILESLKREQDLIKDALASGTCQSYDDYRYFVGLLEGMSKIRGIIADLEKKYLAGDDDDDDDSYNKGKK